MKNLAPATAPDFASHAMLANAATPAKPETAVGNAPNPVYTPRTSAHLANKVSPVRAAC